MSEAATLKPSLTHLALHVRDLAACVKFYESYVGMRVVHDRRADGKRVVWLASPGEESRFILVVLSGGPGRIQSAEDFSHLGVAVHSRAEVDAVAERARRDGILEWEPRDEPYPVGYYCGIKDPDGNFVEFSYGQPLGPGAGDRPRGL